MNNSNRHLGIEILRVLSMLMIVTLHWGGFGIHILELRPFTSEWFFAWGVRGVAYMSVNIYVLISAYFLYDRMVSSKKIYQLWFEVVFYSFGIYILSIAAGNASFSIKSLVYFTTPVLSKAYWYVTSYVGMLLISPYLNLSLKALSMKQHRDLCILLIVLFSVIPNFFFWSNWLNWGTSCGIVWFVVLYVIGAYIRRMYENNAPPKNTRKVLIWSVILWGAPLVSKTIIALIKQSLTGDMVGSSIFYMNNSVIILAGSICTFLLFKTINISGAIKRNLICFMSQGSLAVYLIHEHDCLRELIWDFVDAHTIRAFPHIVLHYLLAIFTIYVSCIVIDFFRRELFACLRINRMADVLSNYTSKIYTKLNI